MPGSLGSQVEQVGPALWKEPSAPALWFLHASWDLTGHSHRPSLQRAQHTGFWEEF